MEILGIDIGGSGIKGAPVNMETGELTAARFRLPTPQPSTPNAVGDVVAAVARHFNWQGPIGCTFPAVIQNGIVLSAANVNKAWLGAPGEELLAQKTGCPLILLNDADAAGIAEMAFGAGQGHRGVVMILTLGTGIGSAIFTNGHLVPNTELGHLKLKGKDAEAWASDRVRKSKDLDWKKWVYRVDKYLARLETLFSPDLFIIGGGVSKRHKKFLPFLKRRTPVVPAQLLNEAGIIGAALAASKLLVAPSPTDGK